MVTRTEIPAPPREPYAEVKRYGEFTYTVKIIDGFMAYGPDGGHWFVLGRKRAERKAERELRRYLREQGYQAEPTIRIEVGR